MVMRSGNKGFGARMSYSDLEKVDRDIGLLGRTISWNKLRAKHINSVG
jgi:hypothetical protein